MLQLDPTGNKFDRIVWNFPHGGITPDSEQDPLLLQKVDEPRFTPVHINWSASALKMFAETVQDFLKVAQSLLSDEENSAIIVTNIATEPFNVWNLQEMAQKVGLYTKAQTKFDYKMY